MTKKHFIFAAKRVREMTRRYAAWVMAQEYVAMFRQFGTNFNEDRFLAACGFPHGDQYKPKTHIRDTRLYVNGGMSFPLCYAGAKLLDLDKGRLPMTNQKHDATCKNCQRIYRKQKADIRTRLLTGVAK